MIHLSFKSFSAVTADAFISLFCFLFLFLFLLYLLFIAKMNKAAQLMPFFIRSLSKEGTRMMLHVRLHGDLGLGLMPAVWPAHKTPCPDELFSSAEEKKKKIQQQAPGE